MATKYAIISTCSSDRFDYKLAADAAGQPRLAMLAYAMVDDGKESFSDPYVVLPDGWRMSPDAAAATGLTDDLLRGPGEPVLGALIAYVELVKDGHVIVAYGAPHHMKLMRGEMRRAGMADHYAETPYIDLMRAMTDVCRLPNPSGRKGFKFPKFAEALAHFGEPCPEVRDAAFDLRASLLLFRKLSAMVKLPAPRFPGAGD